jgi:hypothetical protein
MTNVSKLRPEYTNPHETANQTQERRLIATPRPLKPYYEGRLGSIITFGPLFDICMAVNREIRELHGRPNCCIPAAAAARDILLAKGWKAEVLRVEAVVSHDPSGHCVGVGLDWDGDGRAPAAGPDMWNGHLVAIAERKWILDPTLDQTGISPPMVIEFPDWWLAGEQPIWALFRGGEVRYFAYPGRGGYKSKPDFRLCRRRGIVKSVLNKLDDPQSVH